MNEEGIKLGLRVSFSKVISELEGVSQSITLTLSVDSAYRPDKSGRYFLGPAKAI